jgi:hypothetical protein
VSGPLAPYAEVYEQWLLARGFRPRGVPKRVWQLDHLSRWLEREGVTAGRLSPERAEQFVAARRAAGYRTWVSSLSMRLPLAFLREIGVAPASMPTAPAGEVERLLSVYRQYLVRERGLAESTIYQYGHIARLFLEEREHAGGLQLERLSAADVSGFLARECPKRSVSGARHLVAELRPLLRYLHVMGLIGLPLRWAVPGVADLRDRTLPETSSHTQASRVAAVLKVDSSRPAGACRCQPGRPGRLRGIRASRMRDPCSVGQARCRSRRSRS